VARTQTPRIRIIPSLDKVLNWIKSLEYDEYTQNELIKIAKTFPSGTHHAFKKNIQKYVEQIQKSREQ
jgi:hypothetical protein